VKAQRTLRNADSSINISRSFNVSRNPECCILYAMSWSMGWRGGLEFANGKLQMENNEFQLPYIIEFVISHFSLIAAYLVEAGEGKGWERPDSAPLKASLVRSMA
jgi:hypothetical protein